MAPQDKLEHYEATEAQDLIRHLRALRPPERAVQVPLQVDLTIRAEIGKTQALQQMIALLSMARPELVRVIRQALTDNPMLEEWTPAEDKEPGSRFTSKPSGTIVPDVIVMKAGHEYQVFLNEEGIPRLRISTMQQHLLREGQLGPPEAVHDLRDQLRAAVWLIRTLEQRRRTLYRVATSLVTSQRNFLDQGFASLQPLVLQEVADDLGMHESTVRRVITNKYMSTAHGTIALQDFFHSGIEPGAK